MGRNYKCAQCGEEYLPRQARNARKVLLPPYEKETPQEGVEYEHGRAEEEYKELHECPSCGYTNSYFMESVHRRPKPVVGRGFG